jgi:4'-phosphopantetheinyl transferase
MRLRFLTSDDLFPALGRGEVHLWALPHSDLHFELLTPDERAKADRYKRERTRAQFIASRGRLRLLLGKYLGIAPPDAPLVRSISGKPSLDPSFESDLNFNVSHSDSLGVFAFARGQRVGVDVERLRAIPNKEDLVARFFTAREKRQFEQLAEPEREPAFFRLWTRKEAALKAIGRGVQSLDQCEVTFLPGDEERVLRIEDDGDAAGKWFLKNWNPEPGYLAAVAVELALEGDS